MIFLGTRDIIYIERKELYEIRFKIIEDISKLFSELKLSNIHEQFYVFCYLLWGGYFSVDKSYAYNNRDILDEENTIFLGRGCCRHNANLLKMVFQEMRISIEEISVRISKTKLERMMDIEMKSEFYSENTNSSKALYNHRATLAKDNNGLFYLDPTMLVECEIINRKLVCFNGKYKIDRKLFLKALNRSFIFSDYKKGTISKETLETSYKEASAICEENLQLFDDFFDASHPHYEKIKSLVLKKTYRNRRS